MVDALRKYALLIVMVVGALVGAPRAADAAPSTPSASSTPATTSACSLTSTAPLVQNRTLSGRSYGIYVPTGLSGNARLVLSLHGFGGEPIPHAMSTWFNEFAEDHDTIVAYPQGINADPLWGVPGTGWRFRDAQSPDITYLRAVVAHVSAQYCIDPDRVHVDGFSMGAAMSQRLACEASDTFASVSSHATADVERPWLTNAAYPSEPCSLPRPTPIYLSCGQAEDTTPWDWVYDECAPAADAWDDRLGCDASTASNDALYGYTRTYSGCDDGARFVYRTWPGVGHNYLVNTPLTGGLLKDKWHAELDAFYDATPLP